MSAFTDPVSIANRALQRIGADHMITSFTENHKNAVQAALCYDKLRRAELRRNIWRFATRTCALRPLGLPLPAWDSTISYFLGALVLDGTSNWQSAFSGNLGNDPATQTANVSNVTFAAWDVGTSYLTGAIVFASNGIATVLFIAIANTTGDTPATDAGAHWVEYDGPNNGLVPAFKWDASASYDTGALVYVGTDTSVIYYSLSDGNTSNPTVSGWLIEGGTGSDPFKPWTLYTGLAAMNLSVGAWSSGQAFTPGMICKGSDSAIYVAVQAQTAIDPTADDGTNWALYNGTLTVHPWQSGTSYYVGEAVFPADDASAVYTSTINNNSNDPETGAGWVAQSLCEGLAMFIPWPVGTGPLTQTGTANVFVLPANYLRTAPQAPKVGSYTVLGAPTNLSYSDWVLAGNYLVSTDGGPILFRFIADIVSVPQMDDMFCEGLASRMALELCEPLTNSSAKVQVIAKEYVEFTSAAILQNGIEVGPVEAALDDFLQCRY